MIRIAIVEDDVNCARGLEKYALQYAQKHEKSFRITCFQDGADIAENYEPIFDIILMDIEMKFMNGITAAELIRKVDKDVVIIFITNMVQYAIKGYAVEALDYMVKPISFFAFSHSLDRAIQRLKKKEKHYLIVKNRGDFKKVPIEEIYYLESKGHDLLVHTADDTLLTSGTMKEMESNLEKYHFCRCNKGYLINLNHVNAISDGMAIVGDDQLVISRPRKKIFQEKLAEYMSEVIQ